MINITVAHGSIINTDQPHKHPLDNISKKFLFFPPVETWSQTLMDLMTNCAKRHTNTHNCFIPAHSA